MFHIENALCFHLPPTGPPLSHRLYLYLGRSEIPPSLVAPRIVRSFSVCCTAAAVIVRVSTEAFRFCADCKHNVVTAFDILTCKCDPPDMDNEEEFLPDLFSPFADRIGPVPGDLTGQKALLSCPLEVCHCRLDRQGLGPSCVALDRSARVSHPYKRRECVLCRLAIGLVRCVYVDYLLSFAWVFVASIVLFFACLCACDVCLLSVSVCWPCLLVWRSG